MPLKLKVTAQDAFKLALSLTIGYGIALSLDWDLPRYVGLAITVISLDTLGASLKKAGLRIVGTTVGLPIGLLVISLFAQSMWGTYAFFAVYLIAISYMLQTSKHSYAYFLAGFIPLLIWATVYMARDMSAAGFHYAVFRYLETLLGVVIYSLVSAVLWSRDSGAPLLEAGRQIWDDFGGLFKYLRSELHSSDHSDEVAALRGKLPGGIAKWRTLLDSAETDTPKVANEKKIWDDLRTQIQALNDAMELWAESIPYAQKLDVTSLLPRMESGLGALEKRLELIASLWKVSLSFEGDSALNEASQNVAPLDWEINAVASGQLSHSQRAALMSFVNGLRLLEKLSSQVVCTLRVLAGFETTRGYQPDTETALWYRRVWWDPQRLKLAISPTLCFTVGFFFWIYADPPGGTHLPFLAGVLGLHQVTAGWKPPEVLGLFLIAIVVFVSPIYIFVMPALSTGPELLGLIFVFGFVMGLLGGLNPFIKMVGLIIFVELTGLSNTNQMYSFLVLAYAALVFVMSFGIVALVNMFWTPAYPGRVMLRELRRFFSGCARVTAAMKIARQKGEPRINHRRLRVFNTLIRPALAKLRSTSQHLDYRQFPGNDAAKVRQLLDNLESLNSRLLALEAIQQGVEQRGQGGLGSMGDIGARLRKQIESAFERWARGEITEGLAAEKAALEQIVEDVESQLNAMQVDAGESSEAQRAVEERYTVLGIVAGLLTAMSRTQETLATLNLPQWSAPRF